MRPLDLTHRKYFFSPFHSILLKDLRIRLNWWYVWTRFVIHMYFVYHININVDRQMSCSRNQFLPHAYCIAYALCWLYSGEQKNFTLFVWHKQQKSWTLWQFETTECLLFIANRFSDLVPKRSQTWRHLCKRFCHKMLCTRNIKILLVTAGLRKWSYSYTRPFTICDTFY